MKYTEKNIVGIRFTINSSTYEILNDFRVKDINSNYISEMHKANSIISYLNRGSWKVIKKHKMHEIW